VNYEWDPAKAKANLRKHDVEFADAVSVFADPLAATRTDEDPDEERFVTLGLDAGGGCSLWSTPGAAQTFASSRPARQHLASDKSMRGDP
jgi:uncharacterized DUF497 family protein